MYVVENAAGFPPSDSHAYPCSSGALDSSYKQFPVEIVPVVIVAVGLAVDTFKPWAVFLIPLNRASQPFGEIPALLPA